MSHTATANIGFGIKIDTERFHEVNEVSFHGYLEEYFNEEEYPELQLVVSGHATDRVPNYGKWIFLKTGYQKIYSGISGDGMEKPVKFTYGPEDLLPGILQLEEWKKKNNHEGIYPSWNMVMFFN